MLRPAEKVYHLIPHILECAAPLLLLLRDQGKTRQANRPRTVTVQSSLPNDSTYIIVKCAAPLMLLWLLDQAKAWQARQAHAVPLAQRSVPLDSTLDENHYRNGHMQRQCSLLAL